MRLLSLVMTVSTIALQGCAALPPDREQQVQKEVHDLSLGEGFSVWGGATIEQADRTVLGVALHGENRLGVWAFGRERSATQIGPFHETGYHPDSVAVWDNQNFVVAVEGDRLIQLWQINGNEVKKSAELNSPVPARDLIVADFDGDGHNDIVLAPYSGSGLAMLWGRGGFDFDLGAVLPSGDSPWHPKLVDWDSDGKPDLLWGELDSGYVRLARNLGERRFDVEVLRKVNGTSPRDLAVGDINNDGYRDVVISVEVGGAEILTFGKDGSYSVQTLPAPELGYVAVALLSDGTIVLGDEGRVVLFRFVDGRWSSRELKAGSMPAPLHVRDFDRDGHEDLAIFHSASAGAGVMVHYGPLWENATEIDLVRK